MNFYCLIQVRMGSTRFPGKSLTLINDLTMLEYLINRIKNIKTKKIIVVTTINPLDDAIEILCKKIGIDYFRGSEDNVLDRFYKAIEYYIPFIDMSDYIIRLTGDCPLSDPRIINDCINNTKENHYDYYRTSHDFPDGLDVEIIKYNALKEAWTHATLSEELEHVTYYTWATHPDRYKIGKLNYHTSKYKDLRLAVDREIDLKVVLSIINELRPDFSFNDIVTLYDKHPDLFIHNQHIRRDEGLFTNLSEKNQKSIYKNYTKFD